MESERRSERHTRGIILVTVSILAIVSFVITAVLVTSGRASAFDHAAMLLVRQLDHDHFDGVFVALTMLGAGPPFWAVISLVAFLAIRRHQWPLAMLLAANAAMANGVNQALKHSFGRARPSLYDEIVHPLTFSFPSGHAMSAVEIYGTMALVLVTIYPRQKRIILAFSVPIILGVGLSRVYLGVHWPTDVFAGFVAGIPFLALTIHLVDRMQRPK